MKIIAIILLLLISTFVAFPCTDSHSNDLNDHIEFNATDCANAHSDVVPHQETCTPFCMCSCCSTHLVELDTQVVFILEYTLVNSEEPIFATLDQFISPKITPPKS